MLLYEYYCVTLLYVADNQYRFFRYWHIILYSIVGHLKYYCIFEQTSKSRNRFNDF